MADYDFATDAGRLVFLRELRKARIAPGDTGLEHAKRLIRWESLLSALSAAPLPSPVPAGSGEQDQHGAPRCYICKSIVPTQFSGESDDGWYLFDICPGAASGPNMKLAHHRCRPNAIIIAGVAEQADAGGLNPPSERSAGSIPATRTNQSAGSGEPRCPYCHERSLQTFHRGDAHYAACVSHACRATGPVRPDPASALAAISRVTVPTASEADREIAWLRRLLGWCRPRLSKEGYRPILDRYLAEGPTDPPIDEPRLVQSASPSPPPTIGGTP